MVKKLVLNIPTKSKIHGDLKHNVKACEIILNKECLNRIQGSPNLFSINIISSPCLPFKKTNIREFCFVHLEFIIKIELRFKILYLNK